MALPSYSHSGIHIISVALQTEQILTENAKRSRLSIDLDKNGRELIESLKEADQLSYSELVRKSLALYYAVSTHTRAGGKVVFKHPDGTDQSLLIL